MNRLSRVFPALALGLLMAVPTGAAAQSQQQVDDLRRRVEEVERQLFQQRLATPPAPNQGIERLQMRVQQLEMEIASDRVSRMAAAVASKPGAADKAAPKTLESRVAELEAQREDDLKTIAALVKRIEALEKAKNIRK